MFLLLNDKTQYPFSIQISPNERSQYDAIVQLLKHFGWNWIGILISDNDSGEVFLRALRPRLLESNICTALTQTIPTVTSRTSNDTFTNILGRMFSTLWLHQINVFLVHGDGQSMEGLRIILENYEFVKMCPMERVWIITAQWDFTTIFPWNQFTRMSLNGSLSFSFHTTVVPGYQDFLESINPYQSKIYFIQQFWYIVFDCSLPIYNLFMPNKGNCSGKEKLERLPDSVFEMGLSGQSYNVYNAVYGVAHALHSMYSSRAKQRSMERRHGQDLLKVQPWQV
uniref:Receptor ligand binding region domain-containing protein n=1 Tax=Varanus komodoensis TaxID=61221 RepID=A0A8D2LD35_VARKO